ncbi:MAG: zinc-dependent metalloprotease [candidate division WOR-3 bacterium]
MRKFMMHIIFVSFLYSFETKGSFWATREVWISPRLYTPQQNQWVVNRGIYYWEQKRNDLGPANVMFLWTPDTGYGIVEVRFAGIGGNPLGITETKFTNCSEIVDAKIWLNAYFYPYWTEGRIATIVRHEIGHAAGLADETDNPDCIMYPFLTWPPPEFKQVTQDDVNGLGCLYGGSFNWGNETFTLKEPVAGESYNCEIPLSFGGCNGSGYLYNVKVYIKYDADKPDSRWKFINELTQVRGCEKVINSKRFSPKTKVKVEFYRGQNFKDSLVSGIFYFKCFPPQVLGNLEHEVSSFCDCKKSNLNFQIPENFKIIEIFDITGRKVLLEKNLNKELLFRSINNLKAGIYFIRIITKEKNYIQKIIIE